LVNSGMLRCVCAFASLEYSCVMVDGNVRVDEMATV